MKKKNENSNEIKMEIEPNTSNDLMASGSTNYSNNTHFSMESNNINVSNKSLFCPPQNIINTNTNNNNNNIETQSQSQLEIISQRESSTNDSTALSYEEEDKNNKKIFEYNFESGNEFVLFAGEYLDEIYTNLLCDDEELKCKPKLGYMSSQKDINEQMRAILIDWLIEVHYRFRLKSETLFQTVWIIDTYLTFEQIQRAKLQLLGIASLLISCKSQEIYYPPLKEFIDITDGAYDKNELLEMENNILKILNFNIVSPTSNDFYNIIAKAFNFDKKQFYLGRYFLESALIDYQMLRYSSSVIAVSCAYIVMKFFGINNYKILYNSDVVRERCPQKAIKEAAREICFLVKNLSQSTLKAVKDKYSLSQFLNVAQYCEQK
jgi:cyclin B